MRKYLFTCFLGLSVYSLILGQSYDDMFQRQNPLPSDMELPKIFEEKEIPQEAYNEWMKKRDLKLRDRIAQGDALESALDANLYLVGPGDVFLFKIWGAMEIQVPLTVNPEGKIAIPSLGDIQVAGKSLSQTQEFVLKQAILHYGKSEISLTLEALRFFRIHVVGEVKYPGTYIAQAVDRIPDLISCAGGLTDWAWPREIEIRHENGEKTLFDYSSFEREGDLRKVPFANGGDVIYVPSVDLQKSVVTVVSDIKTGGIYQIFPDEDLLMFLQRIRAVNNNTDVTSIMIIRKSEKGGNDAWIKPFPNRQNFAESFQLLNHDHIIIPSVFVYVKGACRNPGAYPYIMNMTARDYAGMAGADYQAGGIKSVKIYNPITGKFIRGAENIVRAGDVVEVPQSLGNKLRDYGPILSAFGTLLMAGYYIGVFGNR